MSVLLSELPGALDAALQIKDAGVERVRTFHEAFDCVVVDSPKILAMDSIDKGTLRDLATELHEIAKRLKTQAGVANMNRRPALGLYLIRMQLHIEENAELVDGLVNGSVVEVLDALTDISYVVDGTYLTMGLGDLKMAADMEVHNSNMSKLGADGKPVHSVAGRVEKGPNYRKPDLGVILARWLTLQGDDAA